MALLVMAWDLPIGEQMEAYMKKAKTWVPATLEQPGLKELRGYRNPYRTTPQVVVHLEFDSLTSCLKYLESEGYATDISEMRALGCTNYTVGLWDASPLIPEPLRPPSG